MDDHGSSLIRLDPVAHNGPDPPPEFQERVRKGTVMTVPFGKVKLKNEPLFHDFLQKLWFLLFPNTNRTSSTNIEFLLVQPERAYVEIGQLFLLRDGDGDSTVGFLQFAVCWPVLDAHNLHSKNKHSFNRL